MSFEYLVQQAIYNKLLEFPAIVEQEIPIYDDVPQPKDSGDIENFPFIVIGEDSFANWDTDTELGAEVNVTIHTWSRYAGKLETKQLQSLIYDALHRAEFDFKNLSSVLCHFVQSQSFIDADGKTRHGVQTFRMLIEKL